MMQTKKKLTDDTITYEIDYGVGNENGGVTYWSVNGVYKATSQLTMNNAAKRYPASNTLKIGFRTRNVSSDTAKYLGVAWTEYTEKEVKKDCPEAGVQYTKDISVDDRGWMIIEAPAATENNEDIVYYYTLRNSKNKLVEFGEDATDKEGTSVKLKAGDSIELTGLTPGSYKITETVDWVRYGFTMEISGKPFGTTETGKEFKVEVGGARPLIISKPSVVNLPENASEIGRAHV